MEHVLQHLPNKNKLYLRGHEAGFFTKAEALRQFVYVLSQFVYVLN